MEIFYGNLMGILIMDSMGWPYDSFDCLLYYQTDSVDTVSLEVCVNSRSAYYA